MFVFKVPQGFRSDFAFIYLFIYLSLSIADSSCLLLSGTATYSFGPVFYSAQRAPLWLWSALAGVDLGQRRSCAVLCYPAGHPHLQGGLRGGGRRSLSSAICGHVRRSAPGEDVWGLTMLRWSSCYPSPGAEQGFQASASLQHRKGP